MGCSFHQARRQDSETGGAREVYLCEFEGAREVNLSMDQTKKVKTKKKGLRLKISTNFGCLKIFAIFHEF